MGEPFQITRTRSKNYVGVCMVKGCEDPGNNGGPFTTARIHNRVRCALFLRDHCRTAHDIHTGDLFLDTREKDHTVKQPKDEKDLPDPERLADYKNHLVVFTDGKPGTVKSVHGMSEVDVLAYVYLPATKAWKNLGETPIFWKSVAFQINEAMPDSIGGVLVQGTTRNDREWNLLPASKAADKKLLDAFDKEKAEPF